ncbi:MAG: GTPase Era [Parvularculaceae bacterium]
MPSDMPADTKAGFVAVLGAPNAGKSTFVNRMVGAKVSIVTHKVQTTRTRIRGVAIHDKTQLIYVDTPGIFKPRRRLDRAMVAAAWEGASDADVRLLMVDAPAYLSAMTGTETRDNAAARRAADDTDRIIKGLNEASRTAMLVLNKIDLIPREKVLALIEKLNTDATFDETFLISASRGTGVLELRERLIEMMPTGPWLYPEDQLSDISDRLMAAELTREKLMLRLHQELPYSITVETEGWERTKKKDLRIEQVIYVERDSQKALVLGQKGATIKVIGQQAREEMTELFDTTVHLFLFVKVRDKWGDDPARYREMGLEMGD